MPHHYGFLVPVVPEHYAGGFFFGEPTHKGFIGLITQPVREPGLATENPLPPGQFFFLGHFFSASLGS
jgi:hypothetical protein